MIALDKKLHFLGCFALVSAIQLLTGNLWVAVSLTIAIGVVKEVLDYRNPLNYFSWKDIIANTLGIGAYLCFYFLGQYWHPAA